MDIVIPQFLFDTTGDPDAVEKLRDQVEDRDQGRKLRCRSCNHNVTDDSLRISVNENHTHLRVNPGGFEYEFQCFSNAPGCSAFGQSTSDHTWFAGYRWQIAICNHCGEHLGWLFRGQSSFFGLITARIVADDKV